MSRMTRSRAIAAGLAVVFAAQGMGGTAAANSTDLVLREGMALYSQHCAQCHGIEGDGRGPAAGELPYKPRNFLNGSFKFRTAAPGARPARRDLLNVVSNGIAGAKGEAMPSFSFLSRRERVAVVEAVRNFAGFAVYGKPVDPPPPPAGLDAAKGAALFRQLQCTDCHGANGDGKGPLAADMTDEDGDPIQPADLTLGKFKGGQQPVDIWHRIRTGIAGTPMPAFGNSISPEDTWQIVNYVLSLSDNGVENVGN